MLFTLFGLFIILHGLVHIWYVALSARWVPFEPSMGWTSESWLLTPLLGEGATRALAVGVFAVGTLLFVVAGVATLAHAEWWRSALMIAAIYSTASVVLYWDGHPQMIVQKGLIALLINAALIVGLLVTGQA